LTRHLPAKLGKFPQISRKKTKLQISLPRRRRVSRRFSKILLPRRGSSGRRRVSRRFSRNSPPSEGRLWEAVRLASLLKNSPPSEGQLWEAARLASLFKKFLSFGGAALGGGASRVASQEILLPRRGGFGRRRVSRRFSRNSSPSEGQLWEAARLASLLKKFPTHGGAALGGGAARVASQEILLPRRGSSGRRRVSRRFSRNSPPSEGSRPKG